MRWRPDARRGDDVCRPLDSMAEVHHPVGKGGAVTPDALLYYRRGPVDGDGPMLWPFVEFDRATVGPQCLAVILTSCARLHSDVPTAPGHRPTLSEPGS
ncbi:hypothetical protein RKD19_008221 [Streptomyces canus]|uniref:hypothetical protein n=1 Tax=unclassified Streptomyces TaxID=2593676 RepID=UPI00379FF05B